MASNWENTFRLCFLACLAALVSSAACAGELKRPTAEILPHDRPADSPATPPVTLRAGDEMVGIVRLFYDAKNLYLNYSIQDKSPAKNSGDDWKMLFKTGDSVDLQIGLNPDAAVDRTSPVAGDIRVLMTQTSEGPIAVVYRYKVPGTGDPVRFSSPMGTVAVDVVEKLKDAKISIKTNADGYLLDAELPWPSLAGKEFSPRPGMKFVGDVGVLFSDPGGSVTVERIYWSNKHTSIVADVPSEIELKPERWGWFVLR